MSLAHRETMALGSDTRPPVLYRGEFQQWRERFLDFIDKHELNTEIMDSLYNGNKEFYQDLEARVDADPPIPARRIVKTVLTLEEQRRKRADKLARSYLLQELPNDIYMSVDSRKTAAELWKQIERQMKGTEKSKQVKYQSVINSYENFKMREGESIGSTYDHFCKVLNDLRKHGEDKSDMALNYKFINCLRPEWRKFTLLYKDLDGTDVHSLYDDLTQYQDEVNTKAEKKKRNEASSSIDPLALVTQ